MNKIKKLRTEKSLTQEELARVSDKDKTQTKKTSGAENHIKKQRKGIYYE